MDRMTFKIYLRRAKNFWKEYSRNKIGMVGLIISFGFVIVSIFAPWIAPYNPLNLETSRVAQPFSPPAWVMYINKNLSVNNTFGLLGTDELGRDIFSQIVYGSRVSLFIGFTAAFISAIIGTIIGILAGYLGGWIDEALMRLTDTFLIIPTLPLAIVFTAISGPSILNIVFIIGITAWAPTARIIRSQVLSLKERAFIESEKAIGASSWRIMFHTILPNVSSLIYVNIALGIGNAIFTETGLSFLGLGDPNYISWGMMLFFAHQYMAILHGAWWYVIPPGLCILLVIMGFIFIGHALDEVLNPTLRSR